MLAARIIGADADTAELYASDELLIGFEKGRGGYTEVAMALNQTSPGGWQPLQYSDSVYDDSPFAHLEFSSDADILAMADQLSRLAGVSYAEPNYIVSIDETIPDDASFSSLWGMNNTGQTGGTVDADIDAPEAWDLQKGSLKTVVGIIDTGIDYRHPDLYLNVWINQDEIPSNIKSTLVDVDSDGLITFWDLNDSANSGKVADENNNSYIDGGDILAAWADGSDSPDDALNYVDDLVGWDFVNNDNDPFDDNDHGTHVAGTIGGIGNNGIGVVGVNWQVQMIGLKFLSGGGSGTTADAITAVEYATALGADLTNNSWGGGGFSQGLKSAIDASSLFIAAAGNDGSGGLHYPAGYESANIISVAATDHRDVYAGFSNYGSPHVDLAAPGVNILSSLPNGGYQFFDGTSMASPHVAGATALVMAEAARVGITASDAYIKQVLLDSVDPIDAIAGNGNRQTLTNGRLNVFSALGYLEDDPIPPGAVTDLAVTSSGLSTVGLTWTATLDDDGVPDSGKATAYDVRYSTSPINDANWASATPATGEPAPADPGNLETFVVSGLAPSTTYHFALKVRDNVGNESGLSTPPAFATTSAGTVIFADDMENGTGLWVANGLWNSSNYRSNSPSTAWYYGNDTTHTYNTGGTNSGTLSHPFDLTDYSEAILSFSEWSEVEPDATYDLTQVEVSDDGGANWTKAFESHGTADAWVDRMVDLNNYVGGSIDVRFSFDTIDSFENNYEGWYIDDVEVIAEPSGPSIKVSPIAGLVTDEGGATATFDVWLSEPPASDETVTINLDTNDTTEGTVDKTSLEFTDTNWDSHQTVTITGVDDVETGLVDGDIAYKIDIQDSISSHGQDSEFHGLVAADVSVTNLDLDVGISIDDVSLDEGDSETTDFVFTVSLSQVSSTDVFFDYTTAPGTTNPATPDVDYASIPTTQLIIPANTLSREITVQVNGDAGIEPDETFLVELTNPSSNATITDSQGIGTIIDDDFPRLSIDDVTVIEGNGTKVATFTVSLLKTSSTEVNVDYYTSNGTATAGQDYVAIPTTTLTIPKDTLSGTIDVTINGDTNDEENETFFVNLTNANATIVDNQGMGTIGNDDAPPIQIIDNNDQGFSYTGSWVLWSDQGYLGDVHEAIPSGSEDTAFWTFTGLAPGQRYQVSATWTWGGNRATDAPFTILDDSAPIFTEDVYQKVAPLPDVVVSGTNFQHLGDPVMISSGTLVVQLSDDVSGSDPLLNRLNADAIRIELIEPGVTITETGGSTDISEEGPTTDSYEIALNTVPTGPVEITVTADTQSLVSLDGTDFFASVTFNRTDLTAQPITVKAVDDSAIEGSLTSTITHTVTNTGSNYDDVDISDVTANVADNDFATVSIAANDATAAEPSDHGQFTVTTSAASTVDTVVNYNVTGTADAGTDYTSLAGSVTIAATETTATIDVSVIDNAIAENDETVIVTLTLTDNTSITVDLANNADTVTIADEDPGVRINPNAVNISEQGATSDSYDVVLGTQPTADVTVTVDYEATQVSVSPTTLIFTSSNWDEVQQVTVTAVDDSLEEGGHTSVITHSASGGDYGNLPAIDSVTANISDNDAPPVQIIDNNDLGFSKTGSWTLWSNQGYLGDVHEAFPGGSEDKAFWTFTGLTPGQLYQVSATWTWGGNRAPDAPFSILDDSASIYTEDVNQKVAPLADVVVSGTNFQHLGAPVIISSGTLVVELSDDVSGSDPLMNRLNADAIRIEMVPPGVTITESGGSTDVSEEGPTTDSYDIVLDSTPVGQVQIQVTADGQSEISTDSGASYSSSDVLTFTDDLPQTVIVRAKDDTETEGAHTSTISHQITSSSDPSYPTGSLANVTVNVTDNDAAPLAVRSGVVSGVTEGWTSLTLDHTFGSMVVIATVNYDDGSIPLVTRIQNANNNGNSFDVRVQAAGPGTVDPSGYDVHYLVMEEGVYANMEAVKFTSTVTDEDNSWVGQGQTYANSYTNPVVIGQVMTQNDPGWSVFWASNGTRTNPPSSSGLTVGKNVAEDTDTTRADETIGYIVIQAGSGTIGSLEYAAGLGDDTVAGVTNAPPYSYDLTSYGLSAPTGAVLSAAGIDGGNGGWPMLYGADPVTSTNLNLAFDEDTIGDTERAHTTEQVAYIVFEQTTPSLPTISIGDAIAVTEGDTGTVNASFEITLSATPDQDVTVTYSTADGTAKSPADFNEVVNGPLTFAAGTTDLTQTITIAVNGDEIDEGISETFNVTLSNPVNATITGGPGLGTINDDDTAGVTISQTSIALSEGDSPVSSYTVMLDTEPTANVTISFDGGSQVNDPPNLTFTPSDWDTAQTVNVSAIDDNVAEGTHGGAVIHSAASGDPKYAGISIDDVSATITDNDTAGVRISKASVAVTEGGPDDTYTVVLDSEPTGTVTITVGGDSQATGAPTSLEFTTTNWASAQTVTVSAVNDDVDEGDHTGTLTHSASSSDDNYNGALTNNNVTANITDNDTAGVTITPTGTTDVAEGGDTDNYFVVLDSKPTANVTITIDGGLQLNDPPALTFLPDDWDQPQEVIVSAVDDADTEADPHPGTLSHSASSSDENYEGINIDPVTASITDNDFPGVTISKTTTNVTEGGTTDSYTVVLNTVPTDVVTVTVTPANGEINLGNGPGGAVVLTFDPNIAATLDPQTVNVTAVDDDVVEGNHSSLISHSATSTDSDYNGANISIANVTANITDDDTAEFTVSSESGNEDDGAITFTVTLSKEVNVATSVDVSTSDGTALFSDSDYGQIVGQTLNFTAGDTVETFTVTPTPDNKVELNETFTVGLSDVVDGGLSVTASAALGTGTITNDDSAVISINAPSASEGSPLSFSITIDNPVDVAVTADQATADGSATTADSDYTALTSANVQLFAAGSTTALVIPVSTTTDNKVELAETLEMVLSTLAAGGRAVSFSSGADTLTATGTILNDDSAQFTVSSQSGSEDGGPITFTVTLSNPVDATTSVDVSTADGTATLSDNDYTQVVDQTLTFTAGDTVETFTVTPTSDKFVETDETFTVSLSNVGDGGHGGNVTASADTGTGTITNDDVAGVTLSKTDVSVNEEGETSETYTVVLTSQPTGAVTIGITEDDPSGQVTISPTTLTFDNTNLWNTPQEVTVRAVNDDVEEDNPHTSVIVHAITGTVNDPNYSSLSIDSVTANITDNDAPPAPPVLIIDNGDPGFSTVGSWVPYSGQGYENDVHYSASFNGPDAASWTFTDLSPGKYQVSVTWTPDPNRATDVPHRIFDGTNQVYSTSVNQELTPLAEVVESGTNFQHLGEPVTIYSGTLMVDVVELYDTAFNHVIADAVRIVRTGPPGPDTTAPTADLSDPANGSTIATDVLNAQGYIDVTFSDFGVGLDPASITDAGAEFTLAGAGVTVDGAATLVGGTTYRYGFTGNFVDGSVNVDFVAGTFADLAGNPNLQETESFTVETPPIASGPQLEVGVVDNVSDWQTVTLPNSYASMVVVATVDYGGNNVPMVARVKNASGNSFDVRVDRPGGGTVPAGVSVHYLVVEEGVYTQADDGIQMEAIRFNSTVTDRRGSWIGQSSTYSNVYNNPVVVGQVMTANDTDWSVFWARGSSRSSQPSASKLYVGKHVAEDSDTTRANETIGYVVIETGSGSIPGYDYQAKVGNDTVRNSSNNSSGYAYSLDNVLTSPTTAIVSSAAMDGNDGAWPVLYGNNPLTASALNLIVDEDQIRDSERSHTTEQVAYLVFEPTGATSQAVSRSSLVAPAATPTNTDPVESSRDNAGTVDSKSAKLKDKRATSKSATNSVRAPVNAADDADELASVKRVDEALLELLSSGEF